MHSAWRSACPTGAPGRGAAAADLVQRVVLVAAPVPCVLLDAAADFGHDLGAELDDVNGIQDGDRVRQLVADGIGVAPERVEVGVLDPAVKASGCFFGQPA